MEHAPDPTGTPGAADGTRGRRRSRRHAVLAAVAALCLLAAAVGGWWFVVRPSAGAGSAPAAPAASAAPTASAAASPAGGGLQARIVSADEFAAVADSVGHPVFWAGPRAGTRYELSVGADLASYVRYLPEGVPAGSPKADYLLVATYGNDQASDLVAQGGRRAGAVKGTTASGAKVEAESATAQRAYLAFPGVPLLVEIYHPKPGRAFRIAMSGDVRLAQ